MSYSVDELKSKSLDDRREERKEKILKSIRDSADPDKSARVFKQTVAQAVAGEARRVPTEMSTLVSDTNRKTKKVKQEATAIPADAFKDIPEIVPRTPEQRVESMTKRLVEQYRKDPNTIDKLLQEIRMELLRKNGYDMRGLDYQDLRKVAVYFLERAEQISKS